MSSPFDPEPDLPEFSVWMFYQDGSHHAEDSWRWLKAEPACKLAIELTRRPVSIAGFVEKIIIVDSGNFTVWEWQYSKGITFPPEWVGKEFK